MPSQGKSKGGNPNKGKRTTHHRILQNMPDLLQNHPFWGHDNNNDNDIAIIVIERFRLLFLIFNTTNTRINIVYTTTNKNLIRILAEY